MHPRITRNSFRQISHFFIIIGQGSRTAWPLRPPVAGTNRLQRPQIPRLNFFYYASLCSQRNTNSTGHEPTPVGTKSQKWNLLCVYLCSFIGKNKHQTSLEANKIKTSLFVWYVQYFWDRVGREGGKEWYNLIIFQRARKVSKIRGSGHKNIFCSPGFWKSKKQQIRPYCLS